MKLAETVTFGGSGLDRAAHLRGDSKAIAQLCDRDDSRHLPIWRGKPLFSGEKSECLGWLSAGHPVLRDALELPIFLGKDDGAACFAHDISAWEPDAFDSEAFRQFFDPTQYQHPDLPATHQFGELRGSMARLCPREAELVATAKAVLSWHESHGFCAKCGAKSEIAMAGWQRNCPACGTSHFPRTDPVVIMLITHGNDVLIGRSPGWPQGMYSLLAGFVEPGEPIEAAVRRETMEEAGIKVGAVEYLSSQPWPFPTSLMFGCRGEALSREITVDKNELEDSRWISREEMMQAMSAEHPEILPARRGAIAHFILSLWLADKLD